MPKLVLEVAYDGTNYQGWQKSALGPTISEELTKIIHRITQEEIELEAASRTDAGVHALGQTASFYLEKPRDLKKFQDSINALLPACIRVLSLLEIDPSFNPSLDALGKKYIYTITNNPIQIPHKRHFSWHIKEPLDLHAMNNATSYLLGEHDFSAFTNTKHPSHASHIRTLSNISIHQEGSELTIILEGNSFLYKMVRNIVGTLVYVGLGKLFPTDIEYILRSLDRQKAGITAPAHGLTLAKIYYKR